MGGAANFTNISLASSTGAALEFTNSGAQTFTPSAGGLFPPLIQNGGGTTHRGIGLFMPVRWC